MAKKGNGVKTVFGEQKDSISGCWGQVVLTDATGAALPWSFMPSSQIREILPTIAALTPQARGRDMGNPMDPKNG
jgi:hypothetical protein